MALPIHAHTSRSLNAAANSPTSGLSAADPTAEAPAAPPPAACAQCAPTARTRGGLGSA